jgi:hypothetical protein
MAKIPKFVERTCPDDSCSGGYVGTSVKFCCTCGLAIVSRPSDELVSNVDAWNASKLIDDALHFVEMDGETVVYWLPNRDRGKGQGIGDVTGGSDRAVDLSGIATIRDEDLAWFCDKFDHEIATLKRLYGEDSATVGWGLVAYTF